MSQIDIIKENVQYEQLLRESSSSNVLKGEYLIKDSHPDVQKILGIDASTIITNKETLADKVMIEGQINYSLLYLSVDESEMARVNSVNLSEKFADYLDLNNEEHKILCDVECVIEHIQANIMNERKIAIDGVRTVKWQLYKLGEFEFVKDIEGKADIQVQKKSEEINKTIGEKEIELLGKSIIKVTMDKPEIDDILKCSMNLHKKEIKLGDGKIYFGCYCKVEVLYKGRDTDDIVLLQDDVYLSKEEELVGVSSDMISSNQVDIVNYDYIVAPDDLGENRMISVEFLARGLVKVLSKEMIELIKDAYSPSSEMELIKNSYDIGLVHGIVSTDIMLKDNLYPKNEKEKVGSIVLSYGSPIITDKIIENDRIKVEGMLKVSALYRTTDENMQINMCDGEIPFSTIVDLKGTKPHMNAIVQVHLETLDSTVEANTIAVRATLSLSVKLSYKVNREWIVDVVQVRDEPKVKNASVTIYFVNKGDTLWSLAKKYGTTMDVLIKINELDDPDTLNVGQKLIIPGRAIL